MQYMTWYSWAFVLFQHWNIGTLVVLHASVCLCMDFEQEQKFAEPYVIHPELKSAIRYSRRADKHHVLAIVCCNFLGTNGHMRDACDPCAVYARWGGWSTGQYDPCCCWTDKYAECPVGPDSVQHILNQYAKYAKWICKICSYANMQNMHSFIWFCILYIFCI